MEEAFVDDGVNCVVRQISAKYGIPREELEAEFTDISETIQPDIEEGITSMQILEWCKRPDLNGYIVWSHALIAKHEVANQDHNWQSLCVQVVGGLAYVMKSAKRWTHADVRTRQPSRLRKLYTPPKESKEPVFDIVPMLEDHDDYAGDMNFVRDACLRIGIVPNQSMKDFLTIRQLKIPDFGERTITIHSVPQEFHSILQFARLAGLPYRGEGLPSMTLKVLLKLLKPERKDPSKELRARITE